MKNIHLIPTDKPSRLILQDTELYLSKYMEENEGFSEFNQNIYITSDEQIKEGDYFLYDGTGIRYKSNGTEYHGRDLCHISGNRRYPISKSKKIILTTDQDLIKDGVQTIGDEFLEWFVKNPNCEWVEITKDKIRQDKEFNDISHWNIYKYKIIIPQEKSKQETLEEAAENAFVIFQNENPIVPQKHILPFKLGYIESAKWQAERMYSEAIEFAEWIRIKDFQTTSKNNWIGLDMKYYTTQELFEQFKKNK